MHTIPSHFHSLKQIKRMAFPKSFLSFLVLFSLFCSVVFSTTVTYEDGGLVIDGKRRIIISGSIHYPRSTPEMWPELIQKAKEGGLDAIETYVFWNAHEHERRKYNFEGNLDLIRFLKEIRNAGLYAILRIGPYTCAEWTYGGLPVWLHQLPGIELRTDNKLFEEEMQTFVALIVDMVEKAGLLAPQGGPIILAQIENEYGNVQGKYGDAGKRYVDWCAKTAEAFNIGVPWIMCQQADAPQPMINTCNGFYCDNFKPNNPNSPKIWTENWSGWFKAWGNPTPHRRAEDLAYSFARFFQKNGTLANYYMYHGGTNFGRTSGGPYITTSYDYDAPLDEYGNLNQPKWGHLKELHAAIKQMENALAYGTFDSKAVQWPVYITKFSGPEVDVPGCFISNFDDNSDMHVTVNGRQYFIPAWSVSILPDCAEEVYNTAKVTTQTSIMVNRPNHAENEPEALNWQWRLEFMGDQFLGLSGSFQARQLMDQKAAGVDGSDYLWYMTSVDLPQDEKMTLRVKTDGPGLYAFVNSQLIGSQYAHGSPFGFTFERDVQLKTGKNNISLLSVTVGFANYGPMYDLAPNGISGPVKLVGGDLAIDVSSSLWSYKVGLEGEKQELYSPKSPASGWLSGPVLTDAPFTWYKTSFEVPLGNDPVVVDLKGMGKGMAWVNGNSLGRYWPTFIANENGCSSCSYHGNYNPNANCQTGCGEPSQRYYHVPRSFMKEGEPNVLTLFEEVGGDPNEVSFQTVTVGTACGSVPRGKSLTLSCQGSHSISSIDFASFGDASGECGSFKLGTCESTTALSIVREACIGRESCTIDATEEFLGDCNCVCDDYVKLAVQATCS